MDKPPPQGETPEREPMVVKVDQKWCILLLIPASVLPLTSHCSLHSALREFIEPLRTNDSRADFFAVYRKHSDEFDQDYARKYDEDLNTSLIFVSSFISVRLCPQSHNRRLRRVGRSCFGGHLGLHHRRPIQTRT